MSIINIMVEFTFDIKNSTPQLMIIINKSI